jgi:fatty acid desaturase
MSGHLSYQIEHHVFPDLPAHRYPEISAQVQAVCKKYGIHYNTGSFAGQYGTVLKRIAGFSLPDRLRRRLLPEFSAAAAGHAI